MIVSKKGTMKWEKCQCAQGAKTPPGLVTAPALVEMPPAGFEPATDGFEVRYAIQLRYGGASMKKAGHLGPSLGVDGGT